MACLVAAGPLCISRQRASYTSMDYEEDAAKTDGFFDMIFKCQSQRLDEQRAVLPSHTTVRPPPPAPLPPKKTSEDDQLLEMLFKLQHSRLNEQRCEMPSAPHLVSQTSHHHGEGDDESDVLTSSDEEDEDEEEEEEEERDQLVELQPSQNRPLPPPPLPAANIGGPAVSGRRRSTMPSEDFFNLIQHLQSTRIEDQRSPLPVLAN